MTLVIKDLKIYGEEGVLQLDQVREEILKAKEEVLRKSISIYSPDELILVEPVGEVVFYEHLLRIMNLIKDIPLVRIYTSYDVFDMLFLPDNVEVNDISSLPENYDFSSSPVNNEPEVMIDGGLVNVDVNPVWIIDVMPSEDDPVGSVEKFLFSIKSGLVIVITRSPLKAQEKETIETIIKEYNGMIISIVEDFSDADSELEGEVFERIQRRLGRYLGLKLLRGEEL
ncbi:MAG: hypothetical protein J7L34_00300 [Thermotogaceae bacterium]|nr:hypothetical protein [Thermotogaceae bacterium]